MRKIMIWALLVCMVAVLPLRAAAAVDTAVHASESTVKPDTEVTFTVSIAGATGVRGLAVMPVYDKESFTLVGGSWLLPGMITDFDVEKGVGVMAFESGTEVDTQVLTFTLRVNAGAASGEYQIGSDVVVSNGTGNRMELEAAAAKIHVEGAKAPAQTEATEPEVKATEPTEATTAQPTEATAAQPTAPQQTETPQQLPSEEQTQPSQQNIPSVPEKTDGKNPSSWIWGGVIAAACLAGIIAVIVLKKNKV